MRSTFSISIDPKLDEWITKNFKKLGFASKSEMIGIALRQFKDQKEKIPRIRHKYLEVK